MFEFARFTTRNPMYSLKNWRGLSQVRRAMRAHKKDHPACAWCGRSKSLETHHIEPVSVNPLGAGEYRNMISLCRKDHLRVGHNGDFSGRYVENVKEVCESHTVVKITR